MHSPSGPGVQWKITERGKMVYRAKVDWWLATVIGGAAVLEVAAGVVSLVVGLVTGHSDLKNLLIESAVLIAAGMFVGLALWSCYRIRYEITSTDLVTRCGPFRGKLPLYSLVEVFPS